MAGITKVELARRLALEDADSKYCPCCSTVKPLTEFHNRKKERKGVIDKCKVCGKIRNCEWQRKNRLTETREHQRNKTYKHNHNITLEEYEKLLEIQDGKCGICGTNIPGGRFNVFCVDHDHKIKDKRKAIRGLLCLACNHGLGNFKDNPEALLAAAAYILKARNKTQTILKKNNLE
jgi:hypothetical protein